MRLTKLQLPLEWAGYWAVALLLQYLRGDWTGWSSNADEPAHFLTGVMMRDYLLGNLLENPLTYAQNYYDHYPKIGIGHWPPVFYLLQAAWYMLFPPSHVTALMLLAAVAAFIALNISLEIRRFSASLGVPFGLLWLVLPVTRDAGGTVMTELVVTLFAFAGVCCYARYLERPEPSFAAGFGVASALTILSKGTGVVMAVIPLAALLHGRWRLMKRWAFWTPLPIVVLLSGPWYALAPGALHERAEPMGGLGVNTRRGLRLLQGEHLLPWILWIAAAIALIYAIYRVRQSSFAAAGVLLISANLLGASTVAVWEFRHAIMMIPVLLVFCAAGIHALGWQRLGTAATLSAALFCLTLDKPPARQSYMETARIAQGVSPVLVAGSAHVEGGFICEYALQEQRPGGTVLRGSKSLVKLSWFGRELEKRFHSAEQVSRYLAAMDVKMILLDRTASPQRDDIRLLRELLAAYPTQWQEIPQGNASLQFWRRAVN